MTAFCPRRRLWSVPGLNLFLVTVFLGCSQPQARRDLTSEGIGPTRQVIEKLRLGKPEERQRLGLFLEDDDVQFLGCVIYLEGLGDSMMNHFPLFTELNHAGYRVVAFDYFGQGGSEGEMASTRISAYGDPWPVAKDYEIGEQAKNVWQYYSDTKDPQSGRSCAGSPKRVIGWSTGGLAAYKLALENWSDQTVMIAPGIVPNLCVGEASDRSIPHCLQKTVEIDALITLKTLTTAADSYSEGAPNPHLEPIRPNSPMQAKRFAINLTSTAFLHAQHWDIAKNKKGLVFLSGKNDTYVDSEATREVLKNHAPSFTIVSKEGALHEIDNEIPAIATDLRQKIVAFFKASEGPQPAPVRPKSN